MGEIQDAVVHFMQWSRTEKMEWFFICLEDSYKCDLKHIAVISGKNWQDL